MANPRRRQQDIGSTDVRSATVLTPRASAANLSFNARPGRPVDAIAFDFRGLSQTLDTLSRRKSQDKTKKYERSAEQARQVYAKSQLEGKDSENELFDRWQEFATNEGLTEAATVFGQREISRSVGRSTAAALVGQVRNQVENALQSEGAVPEDSSEFWTEAMKASGVDLDGLDFYQMEGLGPIVDLARIEFDQALKKEDYMRDSAAIQEAAQSRVVGYLQGSELSVKGLVKVVGELSTPENGALFAANRKPVLMNALKEMQVELAGDSESFLEILDVVNDLRFEGTRFGDDQSSPDLPKGSTGETYALQLDRMRRQAVQDADKEAEQWLTRSTAKINKAIRTTAEYNQTLDTGDDGVLTNEEVGVLHEQVSQLLADKDLTPAETAEAMQRWSQSMRNSQSSVRTKTDSELRSTLVEQGLETSAVSAKLALREYTAEDVFDMINVPNADLIYGSGGIIELQDVANATAELSTFTTNPTTERVGKILSSLDGTEGLSASEIATISDESSQTLAEIQTAFQAMRVRTSSLSPVLVQTEVENFLKSDLVVDAVKNKRKTTEEARIKTSDREVELARVKGVLNTTALREIAGNDQLPESMRVEAENAIALSDQRSIPQTWGQYTGFMGRLGSLLEIDSAVLQGLDSESLGSFEALLDRQNAGAGTRFVERAREYFVQALEGNDRPLTVVQKEAFEFALSAAEAETSNGTARNIRALERGGKELVEATEDNDRQAGARNKRVEAASVKQVRSFDDYFRDDPSRTSASAASIREISSDLIDAAKTKYSLAPGDDGWLEANQELQIEARRSANEILADLSDEGISSEQGTQLYELGQITPGFWSLDDIAITGQINFRTEGNQDEIIKLRDELRTTATTLNQTNKKIKEMLGDLSPRMRQFRLDRAPIGKQAKREQKQQRKEIKRLETALDKAYALDNDNVITGEPAIDAVNDKNINPLLIPWKRSFEELMKYKSEKPDNWVKFLDAVGVVDEEQFLAEQKRLYK